MAYEENSAYQWTTDQAVRAVQQIRKLKGVETAVIVGNEIRVRTAAGQLTHRFGWLFLPQIDFTLPFHVGSRPAYKYASNSENPRKHPAHRFGLHIGKGGNYRGFCTGEYAQDYEVAHRGGPLQAALVCITMLQTLGPDKKHKNKNWWHEWAMALAFLTWCLLIAGILSSGT